MTDAELTRAAIDASGLSARRFAVQVLIRDERQVRRWLAGDSPLPKPVKDKLLAILEAMPPTLTSTPPQEAKP